jgi:arginyl-tRNA synthetase
MHVGHIRSTILGDAISRVLRLLGHKVTTDNHIGDWGTQFGKLIIGWKRELDPEHLARDPLGEMERLYKKVNAEFEQSEEMASLARQELVKLQNGDPENLAIWEKMIEPSLRGRGLAHRLMEEILAHPDLQGLRRFALITGDAMRLYEEFGFSAGSGTLTYMERR